VSGLALHEFGHFAGLIHEDVRHPNPHSGNGALTRRVSVYESGSVMLSGPAQRPYFFEAPAAPMSDTLSPGDIHGLRCLYWYPEADKERLCHPDAEIPPVSN